MTSRAFLLGPLLLVLFALTLLPPPVAKLFLLGCDLLFERMNLSSFLREPALSFLRDGLRKRIQGLIPRYGIFDHIRGIDFFSGEHFERFALRLGTTHSANSIAV